MQTLMREGLKEGKTLSSKQVNFNFEKLFLSIERTALMAAAANGNKEVLELLITRNAALDLTTPIDHYCGHPCMEILSYGVT